VKLPELSTEAALYDYLREQFGIGEYDATGTVPYWRARNTEIAKLRSTMRRRRVSIEEMLIAVWYADRTRRPITAVWQLCELVMEAKREYRKAHADTSTRDALNNAARQAYAAGDFEWADRLFAADLSTADEVLAQWDRWASGAHS